MISRRGILNLIHSDAQRDAFARHANAMLLSGADAEPLGPDQILQMCPYLDFDTARFPIQDALMQRHSATVSHDAVAWGYARCSDMRGTIRAKKIAMCVAGSPGRVAAMAGMRLPDDGHVDRRLSVHHPGRHAGLLFRRRRVLRRVQGDARLGLLLCAPIDEKGMFAQATRH